MKFMFELDNSDHTVAGLSLKANIWAYILLQYSARATCFEFLIEFASSTHC